MGAKNVYERFIWFDDRVKQKKYPLTFRLCMKTLEKHILNMAGSTTQKVGLRFYKTNRGVGERALDISTFFRSKRNLDKEFEIYWTTKKTIR